MGNNKSISQQDANLNNIHLYTDALKKEHSKYGHFRITPEFLDVNIKNETIYEITLEHTYNYVRVGLAGNRPILFLKIGHEIFKKYDYITAQQINISSTIIDQETIELAIKNCEYMLGYKYAGKLKLNSNILDSLYGIHCISKYNWNINALHLDNIELLLPILKYLKFRILIVVADFNDFAQGKINYEKYVNKNEIDINGICGSFNRYNNWYNSTKPLELST